MKELGNFVPEQFSGRKIPSEVMRLRWQDSAYRAQMRPQFTALGVVVGDTEGYLVGRYQAGLGAGRIAQEIFDLTGKKVKVSENSVRRWLREIAEMRGPLDPQYRARIIAEQRAKWRQDPQMQEAATVVGDLVHYFIKRYCEDKVSSYVISSEIKKMSGGKVLVGPTKIRTVLKAIGVKLRGETESKAAFREDPARRQAQLDRMHSAESHENFSASLKDTLERKKRELLGGEPKAVLTELHHGQKLPVSVMAERIGVKPETIREWMRGEEVGYREERIRINPGNQELYELAVETGVIGQIYGRGREFMEARYLHKLSLIEAGEMVGINSRQRALQIEKKVLKRLRKLLAS